MKKKYVIMLIISAAVMFGLPWLALTFGTVNMGLGLSLLLFFVVNTIYSITLGIYSGRNLREMWSLPVVSAVMYLLSAWALFEMGEIVFVIYAGIYLGLGVAAMLITALIRSKRETSLQEGADT